jgi:gliding motility-associated-like protein
MKTIFTCLLTVAVPAIFGQQLILESGALSMGSNTNLSLYQTSLSVNGSVLADDSSFFSLSPGTAPIEINGNSEVEFGSLEINGDCQLNTNLLVKGNIVLNSGIFDIQNSDVQLNGKLIGENENARVFASGAGEIVVNAYLVNGQKTNPGNLGLSFTPLADMQNFQIARGHEMLSIDGNSSISRYYAFYQPVGFSSSLQFKFLEPETSSSNNNQLKLWIENNNSWSYIDNTDIDLTNNSASANLGVPITKVTLMETVNEEISITVPTGFSPNGDNVNDVFVIDGALNLPKNRLTIFNPWGEIVYEKDYYTNDWEGINTTGKGSSKGTQLADGTYFYIFFKDKDKKNSVVKGFVEIKGGKQ